jgi:hypothetical protein
MRREVAPPAGSSILKKSFTLRIHFSNLRPVFLRIAIAAHHGTLRRSQTIGERRKQQLCIERDTTALFRGNVCLPRNGGAIPLGQFHRFSVLIACLDRPINCCKH